MSGWGIFTGVILGIISAVVIAFVFGYVIMWLWNWLMPAVFHLGTITYWQAFGFALLGRLLFGSFGHHHGHGHHGRKMHKYNPEDFHGRFERWGHDDDWRPKGGWQEWSLYKDYWREEGKDAFEKYVEKHRRPGEPDKPKED